MFILRRCLNNGAQFNFDLGDNYSVDNRITNPEQFKAQMKALDWADGDKNDRHYITHIVNGNLKVFPIYKNDEAYIMTESGKTFEKITQ